MINKYAVAGQNSRFKQAGAEPAGFWAGYWHGLIAPIVLLVSLFTPGVGIYETHNNGAWYDFGFLLGVSVSFGGPKIKINGANKKLSEA